MELLRLFPSTPPRRYVFKDPDTHHLYEAKSKQDLAKQIVAYRSQNGLPPIKHLDIVLEHYWATLPENVAYAEKAPPLRRGFLAYIKGGIALVENLAYGEKNMVSQAVADARAAQCIKCPLNQFPDKGPFIKWSDEIAEASVGDRKTKHHTELGNCVACSCTLKAKVHYAGKIRLSAKEETMMKEVNCWQLKSKE